MTNEEIALKLTDHEHEIKSLKHRIDEQEEKGNALNELAISVKVLAVNMENMGKEQIKQGERLERLEREPADDQRYYKRTVVSCIITGVISAVVGGVMAFILQGGLS